jgi:hypothetical protein
VYATAIRPPQIVTSHLSDPLSFRSAHERQRTHLYASWLIDVIFMFQRHPFCLSLFTRHYYYKLLGLD